MMTYGDIMTLLLTFFVLLLSFSSIQEAKFQEAMGALQSALGVMKDPSSVLESLSQPVETMNQVKDETGSSEMEEVIEMLNESGLQDNFDVFPTKEGFTVRISSPLLFDLGQANLKPESEQVMLDLTDILNSFDNTLRVEGHTCDLPINTARFPSNWELSAARALSVLKFINQRGVESERLSAVGYGEFRPLLPNTKPENRHTNRRVEIYVGMKPEEKTTLEQLFKKENNDG